MCKILKFDTDSDTDIVIGRFDVIKQMFIIASHNDVVHVLAGLILRWVTIAIMVLYPPA